MRRVESGLSWKFDSVFWKTEAGERPKGHVRRVLSFLDIRNVN